MSSWLALSRVGPRVTQFQDSVILIILFHGGGEITWHQTPGSVVAAASQVLLRPKMIFVTRSHFGQMFSHVTVE